MRYKKMLAAVMTAVIVLSGCNTDTHAETSPVTEEVTTTEATTTTTTATTTTSATTTAAPEPEKTYGIIPKEAEGVFEIAAEPMLDVKAIEEKYGYDIDYDFENDPKYPDIAKSYEERHTEEELADIRDIHYLGRYDIAEDAHYINNETADWLVELSWGYYNAQLASFEKFLFIKDGETVLETEIIPMNKWAGEWIYGDTLFFSTSANGIFQLDLMTGEYGFLPGDNWEDIADIDDDYVIYGNGELMIYDRHSRKLITPTVPLGYCPMPGEPQIMQLDSGRIIYNKEDDPDVLYYYDIKGECGGVLTEEYDPVDKKGAYRTVAVYDDDDDLKAVNIISNTDGSTKTFDMTHLPDEYLSESKSEPTRLWKSYFCGGYAVLDVTGYDPFALDIENETIMPVNETTPVSFEEYRMVHRNNAMYGIYWDENWERQAGVLRFTVFRENPPQREGVTYFLTDHIVGTAGYVGCGSDPAEVARTPLYVGDTVAGLTIAEAVTGYDSDGDEYEPCNFKARFDGRIKLKGILHRGKTEDDEFYPVIGGALMFIPSQSSLKEAGLPVLHRNITSYDGKDIEPTVYFKIGSYPEEIIDPLLGDGVSAEAEVVLTDIEMHFAYSGSGYSGYSANILSTSTDAVYDVDTYTLYIPPDCNDVNVGKTASGHSCEIIDLDENNSFFTIDNGCLFSRDMTKLCYVPYFTSEINNYIIAIGNAAEYYYRVPESVTYIAPYAICDEGGWLSGIFVQSGVSDENIDELVLREGFHIFSENELGPPLSGSSFPDDAKHYTERFNTNADEWELLRKNVGNCGKYANEYGDILEWLHNNDGDNLEGYTFSMISTEYQDPHFYCYKDGLPKLMIALDFWRWVKKMGPGDSEPRVPEYTMLDDTVHYDIYVYDISDEPYDDIDRKYNDRYLAEANAIERRK